MKKSAKIIAAIAATAIAGSAAVGGTLAWLTDKAEVGNTFTIGKVDISISEPAVSNPSNILLTPGVDTPKNPTITVESGSVDCYVFAKVYNNFPSEDLTVNYDTTNWVLVPTSETNVSVYRYKDKVTDDRELPPVFDKVKLSEDVDFVGDTSETSEYLEGKNITVTAYAIQAEGLTTDSWDTAYDTLVDENNGLPARNK